MSPGSRQVRGLTSGLPRAGPPKHRPGYEFPGVRGRACGIAAADSFAASLSGFTQRGGFRLAPRGNTTLITGGYIHQGPEGDGITWFHLCLPIVARGFNPFRRSPFSLICFLGSTERQVGNCRGHHLTMQPVSFLTSLQIRDLRSTPVSRSYLADWLFLEIDFHLSLGRFAEAYSGLPSSLFFPVYR